MKMSSDSGWREVFALNDFMELIKKNESWKLTWRLVQIEFEGETPFK